jgi:hypothetical protein
MAIHRSAWNKNSANFAFREFSEVRGEFIRNSSPIASVVALINWEGLEDSPSLRGKGASVGEETRNRYFDELARGLAEGNVTRGKALRLMGAAVVGGALASLGIREAAADPPGCKRNGKNCTKDKVCCSGNCEGGTCSDPCPSGTVELSNGTCAKPCGTEPGQCNCGSGCFGANSGGGYCADIPSSSQSPCETDDQCTIGEFCSGLVCIRAC